MHVCIFSFSSHFVFEDEILVLIVSVPVFAYILLSVTKIKPIYQLLVAEQLCLKITLHQLS